jgi:uncharacterized protein (TIGR00369 family)
MDIPAGWQLHTRKSPLTEPWEPIYARQQPRALELALRVRAAHCNGRGTAHGGLIAALADNAMGLSAGVAVAADQGTPPRGAVTVSLAMDYLDAAQVGEWLEVRPTVLKAGRTLAFVECLVCCGERTIARGNATFKLG